MRRELIQKPKRPAVVLISVLCWEGGGSYSGQTRRVRRCKLESDTAASELVNVSARIAAKQLVNPWAALARTWSNNINRWTHSTGKASNTAAGRAAPAEINWPVTWPCTGFKTLQGEGSRLSAQLQVTWTSQRTQGGNEIPELHLLVNDHFVLLFTSQLSKTDRLTTLFIPYGGSAREISKIAWGRKKILFHWTQ